MEVLTLALKNKFYAKRFTVFPSPAVESHLQHGIFRTIYLNLEIPPLVAEISFTCSIPQTIRTKVSPCSFHQSCAERIMPTFCNVFYPRMPTFLKVFHPWITWLQLSLYNPFDHTHELKFIHWHVNKFSIELNRKLVQSSVNEHYTKHHSSISLEK